MAVSGAAKEKDGRTSSFTGGNWTRSRTWQVQVTSRADFEDTVSTASGLPAYSDVHPADSTSYAREISYTQINALAWEVTVTYSTERQLASDPEDDEALVSFDSEIYQEPVFKDRMGNAILNSAGDAYVDPVPARDAAQLIAKIRKNVTSVPAWVIDYQRSVNDGSITIGGLAIAAGKAKAQRVAIGERQKRGLVTFYELSYEVHLNKDGWHLQPLDAGLRERNTAGKLVDIINEGDNSPPSSPVPLDGAGHVQNNPLPSTAEFGDYDVYEPLDYTALPGIS